VTERLEEFRNEAKDVVRKACRIALRAVGFIPDDCVFESKDGMKGKEPRYVRSSSSLKH
jgi:dynein heavy chain